jgi:hypothetical protein
MRYTGSMISRTTIASHVLVALVMVLPLFVAAAPIVPCGGTGQPACTVCHLGQLAQNILNFLIYIAITLCVFIIIWAGFLYLTAGGDPSKAKKAKGMFLKVVLGLILMLSAWLIIDLLIRFMVDPSKLGGPWQKIC